MKRLICILLLLLGSHAASAYDFPVEVIEYIDDVKVVAYIDKHEFDTTQQWSPFDSQPPLSVYDALQTVLHHLQSDYHFAHARLSGIELKQVPKHENYWHYLVRAEYLNQRNVFETHYYVVMMDGKLFTALREPEAVK